MRLLFAAQQDVSDINRESGTPFYMAEALAAKVLNFATISPLSSRLNYPFKVIEEARNLLFQSYYSRLREPAILKSFARSIEEAVKFYKPDVIISPSTLPLAYLSTSIPCVVWTDATFAAMLDYYPNFSALSPRYRRLGHEAERRALNRASLSIFSSKWAMMSASSHYGTPDGRLAVVPFGANLHGMAPSSSALENVGKSARWRFLIVAVEWERKGVGRAIELITRLRQASFDVSLDIVGISPTDARATYSKFVRYHGRLDKSKSEDASILNSLYANANFFVLPSRADCTPMVIAEAFRHGVPVLSTDTGGIPSMVEDGFNGFTFSVDRFVDGALPHLAGLLTHAGEEYERLVSGARKCANVFRWDKAAGDVVQRLESCI